jgi:inward rectifier potassium channel
MEEHKEVHELIVDPGFGTKSITRGRIILRNGRYNVVRKGKKYYDAYLFLVGLPWLRFILILFVGFLILNSVFAIMYTIVGVEQLTGIVKTHSIKDFISALYFSVQTFTTVGYGAIHPQGLGANLISIVNAFTGLMGFALATGLLFARFSKPGNSILFSDIGVIAPWEDKTAFMFRIANLHNNKVVDVEADVLVTWLEEVQGSLARRYSRIDLAIDKITMFPVNWTIVHVIDTDSPLYCKKSEELDAIGFEIIAHIKGYDETYAQMINASYSYKGKDIRWGKKFKLMYKNTKTHIDLRLDHINELIDAPLPK